MTRFRVFGSVLLIAATVALMSAPGAEAASRQELNRDGIKALQSLYAMNPAARRLGDKARAVLVFPNILKAGFLFGGQIGEGVLLKGGKPAAYYNSVAASYGLQAGVQTFGYALFFMNDGALKYLDSSAGFELGVVPSILPGAARMATSIPSTTLSQDVYAFIFSQKGLMAGIGLQGSKITRISK